MWHCYVQYAKRLYPIVAILFVRTPELKEVKNEETVLNKKFLFCLRAQKRPECLDLDMTAINCVLKLKSFELCLTYCVITKVRKQMSEASSCWLHCDDLPSLLTSCNTTLSPATAQRTSNAKSSHSTSQFSFDCARKNMGLNISRTSSVLE